MYEFYTKSTKGLHNFMHVINAALK